MPAAGLAALGAVGAGAMAVGQGVAAANRKKYAQYIPPDMQNFKLGGEGDRFYQMGQDAQKRTMDPFVREQQLKLIGTLQGAAEGRGPIADAAGLQIQAGRDQAIKTAMALAGSARGPNPGANVIGANTAAVNATANAGNAAAQQLAANQFNAIGQLGGVLGSMRQEDLAEQTRLDQLEKFYTEMGASREEAALRAKQQYENEVGRRYMGYQGLAAEEEGAKQAGIQKAFAAGGQAFSSLGAMGGQMGGGGKK